MHAHAFTPIYQSHNLSESFPTMHGGREGKKDRGRKEWSGTRERRRKEEESKGKKGRGKLLGGSHLVRGKELKKRIEM